MKTQPLLLTVVVFISALYPREAVGNEKSSLKNYISEEFERETISKTHNDYGTGFGEIITFFNSINTTLTNLKLKVSTLAKKIANMEKDFGNSTNNFQAESINSRLRRLECQTAVDATCLPWLPEPKSGLSFQGKSVEAISGAIPGETTFTVQIKNYLDVSLFNYKSHLPSGQVDIDAPAIINLKTKEVFTFKQKKNSSPVGTFLYRINGTDFALHVYFYSDLSSRNLATAFLKNLDNPISFLRATPEKHLTTNPAGFSRTDMLGKTEEAIIQNISESGLFARSTFTFQAAGKGLLTIQLFGQYGNA